MEVLNKNAGLVVLFALALGHQVPTLAQEPSAGFYGRHWPAVSVPHTRIVLSSELDENVEEVLVREGQPVREGEPLVRFDDRLINARIAVAEAEADFEARIEQARAESEYLAREFDRSDKLGKFISESELDKARHEKDIARLKLEDLKRAERLANATLDYYRTQAEDYVIRSPIDGAVSHVWMERGEMATQGQKLLEVIDPDVVEVRVHVAEEHAGLACGQKAMIRFTALTDREFEGEVSGVSPTVESSSGTYTVKVLVKPGAGAVKPGMACAVRFVPR